MQDKRYRFEQRKAMALYGQGSLMSVEFADKVACKPEIHRPSIPRGAPAAHAATPPLIMSFVNSLKAH
ncbi:hypothetical protein BIY29_18295 [Brenneria alni]|uniref:Uncharacterized protein n=1 Tax=Brenneria alni TaxID=71656 RepID=A0A421DJ88_9GAMM|nr:hypothetical protein BIY29_18295 [Brenneria alni]